MILLSLTFFFAFVHSQKSDSVSLPINKPGYKWPLLRNSISNDLTKKLQKELNTEKLWSTLIKQKKFAVGVVDISDIYNPKVAWINGNVMMYAASLPKIAVLLAAMQAIEDGELEETDSLIADMTAMIRISDNAATTRIIDKISMKKIEQVVCSPEYHLFNPQKGGGLWVGKRYAKTGKRNPDPLKGLSHAATVSQVCRFYYLLATGRLVSPEKSKQMLEIMAYPQKHHKFVHELEKKFSLSRIFRKSGTWKIWHSDSALIWSKDGSTRCIIVGMVEHAEGEQILRDLIPVVERILDIP